MQAASERFFACAIPSGASNTSGPLVPVSIDLRPAAIAESWTASVAVFDSKYAQGVPRWCSAGALRQVVGSFCR